MKLIFKLLSAAILCSISYSSCIFNETASDPLSDFSFIEPTHLPVINRIELEQYGIYKPGNIVKFDDKYIIQDQSDDYLIKAINAKESAVYKGFHRGNGPEEFILISSLQVVDSVPFVYDIVKKQLHKLSFNDSVITSEIVFTLSTEDRPSLVLNTSKGIVESGVFQEGWIKYSNAKGIQIATLDFPEFSVLDHLTSTDQSIIYMSTLMAAKPDGNKIAFATQKAGVLAIAEYSEDSLAEIVQKRYFPADVVKGANGQIAYRKEGKVGFCDISCSNDLIYALYSGKVRETAGSSAFHCQHMLVYDWDGNPVKHFILEQNMLSAKYDSESNKIYGIGYAPEGCILEYDLNEK